MSRSPSRNQSSPPQAAADSSAFQRLVGPPPAALRVDQIAERVEQAVEVGRDVEPEDLDVVADVADHGQLARLEDSCKPRAKRAPPPPPESRTTLTPERREVRACAGRVPRRGARGPHPSRRRPRAPGWRPSRRAHVRGSDPRSPARRAARTTLGSGSESAFVVPSGASTSARPASASCRRASGVTRGRSALTTSAWPSTRARPTATAAPSPSPDRARSRPRPGRPRHRRSPRRHDRADERPRRRRRASRPRAPPERRARGGASRLRGTG